MRVYTPRQNLRPNLVMLFSHGNATDVTHMDTGLLSMAELIGLRIVAWEYPWLRWRCGGRALRCRPPSGGGGGV